MSKFIYSLKIAVVIIVSALFIPAGVSADIKEPNVSGQFYPNDSKILIQQIDSFIEKAQIPQIDHHIEMIVVPHAGYPYSGQVAGHAFKAVKDKDFETIILVGPSHFYGFNHIATWAKGGFKTPLGILSVDESLVERFLESNDNIKADSGKFAKEHALEVEMPFIQRIFPEAKIAPFIFGYVSLETLKGFAETLKDIISDRDDVLIVVSCDLSHYHPYEKANELDKQSVQTMVDLDYNAMYYKSLQKTMEVDAFMPVTAMLYYAQLTGLNKVDVLKYANSGDVTKDKSRVVGYSAIAFYKDHQERMDFSQAQNLSDQQKRELLTLARQAMEQYVRSGNLPDIKFSDSRLLEEEGAFVSIYKNGQLRGCLGNIIGDGPLCLTVRNMAASSAVNDTRFKPIEVDELDEVELEISVLSKPVKINDVDQIVLGKHGVIVSRGFKNRGVFLPQVATKTKWSKERFLSELCSQKAHLPEDCWKDPKTNIEIFSADVFHEKEFIENE